MAAKIVIYARWLAIAVIVLCVLLIIARWKLPMREQRRARRTQRPRPGFWKRLLSRRLDSRERAESLRALRGKNVLVVDPRDKSARVLDWELSKLRCVIRRARSGAQALSQVRRSMPDVIIADALLPDMSARDFFRALGFPHAVVVFVGVASDQCDQLRSLGRNVGCVPRPYDPEEAAALAGRLCLGAKDGPAT